ncbi:putative MarR family transcriptional regulator [Gordonia effusa NBRC 100432]|uniref:Putative MarR family transcriptional regulator n=1 Tax=Gordonia effusa NBRC 100432 TaxID=1077974 RepID=H0R0L6_9ACTN|nr:MarR family transcriptional regulator [Gordonia effusa]GAB18617.1 putative MarR family transcriptional regulator [Gordonia effusa NBRC 100432]
MSDNRNKAKTRNTKGADDREALLAPAAQLCFALYSTSQAMTAAYRPFLDRMGITYPQYLVLLALWEQPGRSIRDLCELLQLGYGTLSPLVKRLTIAGLITADRSATDRRAVTLTPTAAGYRLKPASIEMIEAVTAAAGATNEEVQEMRALIVTLRDQLEIAAQTLARANVGA